MSSQQPPCRHCCSLDLSKLCKHVRYKSAIHADESSTNTATTSSPSYSMYDHAWSSAVVTCRGEPWSTAWSGLGSSVCDCMCTQCVCAEGGNKRWLMRAAYGYMMVFCGFILKGWFYERMQSGQSTTLTPLFLSWGINCTWAMKSSFLTDFRTSFIISCWPICWTFHRILLCLCSLIIY